MEHGKHMMSGMMMSDKEMEGMMNKPNMKKAMGSKKMSMAEKKKKMLKEKMGKMKKK